MASAGCFAAPSCFAPGGYETEAIDSLSFAHGHGGSVGFWAFGIRLLRLTVDSFSSVFATVVSTA